MSPLRAPRDRIHREAVCVRLTRLHLIRYGALTDDELIFRRDAAIHVVHGGNEAGKSTALNALSDLLFGFGHAKTHDFRHDANTLRIAATLESRDGASVSFRRRRGNKNTLLSDTDDEDPLRDDTLAPYLGSVTRPIFERAFGLDSTRLRAGSGEMLASDGEMGTMLFAASSGILGLAATRRALEAEADEIFAPRKSTQRLFYQLLERHKEARDDERNLELRAAIWKRLNDDIDRLREGYDDRTRERAEVRARQQEIEKLTRLKPLIAEMDDEHRALSVFTDLDGFPAGMGEQLDTGLDAEQRAADGLRQAELAVDKAIRAIEAIDLAPEIFERIAEIERRAEDRGAVRKHLQDLPRVSAESDAKSGQLADLAARLGIAADRFALAQPTDPQIARIEEDLAHLHDVQGRRAGTRKRLEEEQRSLRQFDEKRPQAALIDPEPFRRRLSAIRPDIDRLAALAGACAEIAVRRRRLQEQAARLDPSIEDLERIALAPLPGRAELQAVRDAINEARRKVATRIEELATEREELARLEQTIALDRPGDLPTREVIDAARRARDEAIGRLPALAAEGVPDVVNRGVSELRPLVKAADTLADQASNEAERLARVAGNVDRGDTLTRSVRALEEDLTKAEGETARIEAAFVDLFAKAGIAAADPDRMIEWLSALTALLEKREEIETEADRIEAAAGLEDSLVAPLVDIARETGVSGFDSLPVAALYRAVEDRLQAIQTVWDDSRANTVRREQSAERIKRLEDELEETAAAHDAALADLQKGAETLGIGSDAGSVELETAVAIWKTVPGIKSAWENLDRRVRGMKRDIAEFEEGVIGLVEKSAPDLEGREPADAIVELNERARSAKSAAERESAARGERVEAQERLEEAQRLADEGRAHVAAVLEGYSGPEDPRTLAKRLKERDALRTRLADARERFRQIAPGEDEAVIRARLETFDPVEASAEGDRLSAEETRLDTEVNEIYAQRSAREEERRRLQASNGAETAAFRRRSAEAELAEASRQWAILKLSSLLLGAALDRQRADSADPTLTRAGDSFSVLTSGAFTRLSKRFRDDDTPELVAVRANGDEVRLNEMSDGTVDQLHLALRIAYLEDYATRNEPMPFIADDIFQTFDDARTGAAITALGAGSATVQPIVFTHHLSVVEAAQQVYGDRADIIEL